MIAKNYRTYPEALLYQLELALGDVADTIQAIRAKGGAAWANLVRRYQEAGPDIRGVRAMPVWFKGLQKRRQALARAVRAAIFLIS